MLIEIVSMIPRPVFDYEIPDLNQNQVVAIVMIGFFSIFLCAEIFMPKRKSSRVAMQRSLLTNFGLFVFNSTVMALLSASSLLLIARNNQFTGLLFALTDPVMKTVVSLLALDFLLYIWHRVCHRFDFFWMFHKIHHSDTSVNVSTGFRLHIIEVLITFVLKGLTIIALGINELTVLISETCTTLFIMFHHTNIACKAEKWFGYLFITPHLHRTHHSVERSEHDSNYGAILSVWDHMLGTLHNVEPQSLGIKGDSPTDIIGLLMFGFIDQIPNNKTAILPANLETMIAIAAYYKAEKRNFDPNYDLNNWLEAKQDILAMIEKNKKSNNHNWLFCFQERFKNWCSQYCFPQMLKLKH